MKGLHITAELHGCPAQGTALTNTESLRRLCLQAGQRAGLTPVGELFDAFAAPGGPGGPG